MKKIFISQPMTGLSDEKVWEKREEVTEILEEQGYEVIDSFIKESTNTNNMYMLGISILLLSKADVIYFVKDWKNSRGCRIEHMIAEEYGIERIYEGE